MELPYFFHHIIPSVVGSLVHVEYYRGVKIDGQWAEWDHHWANLLKFLPLLGDAFAMCCPSSDCAPMFDHACHEFQVYPEYDTSFR